MTSHNVALWDINITLWAIFLFIVYNIVGYISIYSNKKIPSLKNYLFDFQLA